MKIKQAIVELVKNSELQEGDIILITHKNISGMVGSVSRSVMEPVELIDGKKSDFKLPFCYITVDIDDKELKEKDDNIRTFKMSSHAFSNKIIKIIEKI